MTVETTTSKAGPYAGAGTVGPFPVPFRFLDASHLQVTRTDPDGNDTVLALSTNYTVQGVGQTTGAVTLTQPLSAGFLLTVLRNVPTTQEADYVQNDAFPAESHERALDKLTMLAQQIDERGGRALVVPASEPNISLVLPKAAARARRYLSFDEQGRPVSTTFDIDAVQEASQAAQDAAAAAKDSEIQADTSKAAAAEFANDAQELSNFVARQVAAATPTVVRFSGDGEQVQFDLPSVPGAEENTQVYISGVYQQKNTYDVTPGTGSLVFDSAPPVGAGNIEVVVAPSVMLEIGDVKDIYYDGGTAQEVLDNAKPMQSYTALRAYTGRATGVRITSQGLAGFFQRIGGAQGDNGGTYIVDGLGRTWERILGNRVSSDMFGLVEGHTLTPAQTASTLMALFNFCAGSGRVAVVEDRTFIVDHYPGAPTATNILHMPSNLTVFWTPGCLIQRAPFTTGAIWSRTVSCDNRSNQSFYGKLTIDGAGDTTAGYVEHSHCFFIFTTKNLYVESIEAYNAMGDCVSLSGNAAYSENIKIDKIVGRRARRKCLVLETMMGFTLGHVTLDNSDYMLNCVDYEPLGVITGLSAPTYGGKIGYLRIIGGFDATHGTAAALNDKYPMDIDVLHIELPTGWTAPAFFSYGSNLKIGRLFIDGSRSSVTTDGLFVTQYAPKINIGALRIITPSGYTGIAVSTAAAGAGATPDIYIAEAHLSGQGSLRLQFLGAGIKIAKLQLIGDPSAGSVGAIVSQATGVMHHVEIDSIYAQNVTGPALLSHSIFGANKAQLFKVGTVAVVDTVGTLHPTAVVAFNTSGNDSLVIGGITGSGYTLLPYANNPGQVGWYRTAGGVGVVSSFVRFGATPEAFIPAKIGSVCQCTTGPFFVKMLDDGLSTGWKLVTTA